MIYLPTVIVSVLVGLLLVGASWFFIRREYRNFCRREEQKERIVVLKKKVESARDYIRKTYNTPMDTSVQDNIIPKMEFIEKLIMNKSPDEQEKELNFLIAMLTETFVRLRENYDDVRFIVAPLNTLRDRLVSEHLRYIREHMDEQMDFDISSQR